MIKVELRENMPEERCAGNGLSEGKVLGYSEGDGMENRGAGKDGENGGGGGVRVPDSEREVQQQQVQGPVVRWDRFLPFRSLKVLLVENDDCTRQVVSALLRNCSYEVVAVANGVQAWRYLEDLTNHTDLILAEVVMPIISGIGLLYKIMNHKTFKNIPVIMMSSHDSMGIVFKCLSRGAVDFLVKPIRKNELKNLWQHVWRRCHSSSGSGSESRTMSRKSVRSKRSDIPDDSNNSGEHECASVGPSSEEDDEYASGARSSWTKRAAELGSPQPTADELNDAPDSTCAQVIHTKPDPVCNGRENVNVAEENEEQKERFGACKDESLEQGNLRQFLSENPTTGLNKFPEPDSAGKQKMEFDSANRLFNRENQQPEIVGVITSSNMHVEENTTEASNGVVVECSCKDEVEVGPVELPILGLKSKKERYTCGPSLFQDSKKDRRILFPANNGSVATGTPVMLTYPPHSSSNPIQLASGFIDKNGGIATLNPKACADVMESSIPQNAICSSVQAVQTNCTVQPEKIEEADDVAMEIQVQPRESQQVHVEHHHHHHHHYHHHIHDVQHHPTVTNQDQCSLENPSTAAVGCASSNAFTETGESNAGNFSLNGIGSGSHYGSNGKDGSQHGSNQQDVGTNTDNDNALVRNSSIDMVDTNNVSNGSDKDQFSQRDAALTTFRQKRKERSFEKKIRSQGRKKVADQQSRTGEQCLQPITCDAKVEDEDDTKLAELAFRDNTSDNVQ